MWSRSALRNMLASLAACALLMAAAAFLVSCGEGNKGGGREGEIVIEDQGDVDILLKEIDAAMDAVNADDFSPDELGDGALGL